MTFYWKVRKDFLDYIEDSMSHDSLIGSTISTRSKKNVSCASKISPPSVLSHDTKTSKGSEKDNPHDFYPKNFNHALLSKPDIEGYMNNAKKEFEKKIRITQVKNSIKYQTILVSDYLYENSQGKNTDNASCK
jgi:hypothetical protein